MVDPIGLAAAAAGRAIDPVATEAGKVGTTLITNLFGPLSEELGRDLLSKYKNRNVERVVERAAKKEQGSSGSIPPRVGAAVFDAASFADDEFVAEYLSGVLASARTEGGTDDRGVTWTALVSRLSADALRLHYAIYAGFSKAVSGATPEYFSQLLVEYLVDANEVSRLFETMDEVRILDAFYALAHEGLIDDVAHGHAEFMGNHFRPARVVTLDFSLAFEPTLRGATLFMHGLGRGQTWVGSITSLADEWQADLPVENLDLHLASDFPLAASNPG